MLVEYCLTSAFFVAGYGRKTFSGESSSSEHPEKVIARKDYGWRKPSLAGSFLVQLPGQLPIMKCQYCKKEITLKSNYCPVCGQKLNSERHSKKPKINLFVLVAISFLTGGIYFPIWFLRRRSFFGYNHPQNFILNNWLIIITIALGIAVVANGWYGANLRSIEIGFREQSLEKIKTGEDILSVYKDNPGMLDRRFSLERNVYNTQLAIDVIGLFLLVHSFATRFVINTYLRKARQKEIPIWLWFVSGFCFFMFFTAVFGSTGFLWVNLPLIFLVQYKINRLPE